MKGLNLALSFMPSVLQGIVAVENIMAGAPGAAKKAVVLASVQAAAKVGETVPEAHVQTISALIDAIVAALNGTGWFKTSGGAASAAAPAHTAPPTPAPAS